MPTRSPFIPTVEARDYPPFEQEWTEENVKLLIRDKARKYNVSAEEMIATVKCESGFNPYLQSYIEVENGVNGREDSWGLAQWWLPAKNTTKDGRVITKEMALDPVLSIETMAWYFSLGEKYKRKWTCWRTLYLGEQPP